MGSHEGKKRILQYLGHFDNFVTALCRNTFKKFSKMPHVLEVLIELYEYIYNGYLDRYNLFPSLTNFELQALAKVLQSYVGQAQLAEAVSYKYVLM